MKRFEIRSRDLSQFFYVCGEDWTEIEAKDKYSEIKSSLDCVLVLHEFETKAEADKARLDWLQENIYQDRGHLIVCINHQSDFLKGTVRELIDKARQAPPPKVTVIES